MLFGHRFERTAQDDLHIHSRNLVQSAFVLLTGALAFILPVAFAVFVIADEGSPLTDLDPLTSLLFVLGLLLIPALGLLLMVYTGIRETLLLSRRDGEGKRRTRNFLGVASVFIRSLESIPPTTSNFAAPRCRARLHPAVAGDARWHRAPPDY